MVLLGDEAQVESHFGPFGNIVSISARYVNGLCQTYHRLRKPFLTHPMELLGDEAQGESCFGSYGDSVTISAT